jgi:hypothetical protein
MSNERDELAGQVAGIFLDGAAHEASGMDIAHAVLTHLHPAVHTAEEANALPLGSVVLDAFGASCTKVSEGSLGWRRVTPAVAGGEGHWHGPYVPATVLYEPEASK